MTIDKIQPAALSVAREAKADALAARQQQSAAVQQQTTQRRADVAVLPVKVSAAAKEMAQAVRQVAGDEAFDQKKVDRIRKEILEGRFPIDEERLARKFMELENELGELGRSRHPTTPPPTTSVTLSHSARKSAISSKKSTQSCAAVMV